MFGSGLISVTEGCWIFTTLPRWRGGCPERAAARAVAVDVAQVASGRPVRPAVLNWHVDERVERADLGAAEAQQRLARRYRRSTVLCASFW